jgi:hypothetical protein
MAIMRISRFRDSPETVLAFKHLSDFAEMQPVREPVATLDAMDIEHGLASSCISTAASTTPDSPGDGRASRSFARFATLF